jgi:hypothetical protein
MDNPWESRIAGDFKQSFWCLREKKPKLFTLGPGSPRCPPFRQPETVMKIGRDTRQLMSQDIECPNQTRSQYRHFSWIAASQNITDLLFSCWVAPQTLFLPKIFKMWNPFASMVYPTIFYWLNIRNSSDEILHLRFESWFIIIFPREYTYIFIRIYVCIS